MALEARLQTEFTGALSPSISPAIWARRRRAKAKSCNRAHPAQWNNVRYAYRDTRRYAERQGYMLKGTEKMWDSSTVNIGILWVMQNARDRLADYLEAVYRPFGNAN